MFRRFNILSLTSRASVLASGECQLLFFLNTVLIVGVQLPLVVRTKHRVRCEWFWMEARVIISWAVGGVAVSRGVVGSSSFQCSDRTDELRSGEAKLLRQSALVMCYIVQCEGENTFCLIFQESIFLISWCCSTDLRCDLVDISNSL